MLRISLSILSSVLIIGSGCFNPSDPNSRSLIIATATPGGTYYPVGISIGALISLKLGSKYKITATAIDSAGSGENIQMLKNREADFAILQAFPWTRNRKL